MGFCLFSLALVAAFVSKAVAPRVRIQYLTIALCQSKEQVTEDAMRISRRTWVLALSELKKKIIIRRGTLS